MFLALIIAMIYSPLQKIIPKIEFCTDYYLYYVYIIIFIIDVFLLYIDITSYNIIIKIKFKKLINNIFIFIIKNF